MFSAPFPLFYHFFYHFGELNQRFLNIGIETPEVSVTELAAIFQGAGRELFGYQGTISYAVSEDRHYLTDNPQRRCPDITKARTILEYHPEIRVDEGVTRFLRFWKEESV